jgi:hypothetical protein
MKRALLALTAAMMLLASQTGCQLTRQNAACGSCRGGCPTCGNGNVYGSRDAPGFLDMMHAKHAQARNAPAGPQTPTYGYPYYTSRGPRDFLVDNPPSIGR